MTRSSFTAGRGLPSISGVDNERRDGMHSKRARYIYMKGWVVEEYQQTGWVRIYQQLTRDEAEFIAYGWGTK